MKIPKIEKVAFMEDYQIHIYLPDDENFTYDMRPRLNTMRFYDLRNEEFFSRGKLINGTIIRWSKNMEISLEEIWAQRTERFHLV